VLVHPRGDRAEVPERRDQAVAGRFGAGQPLEHHDVSRGLAVFHQYNGMKLVALNDLRGADPGVRAQRVQPGQFGGDLVERLVAVPVHAQDGALVAGFDQVGRVLADVEQRQRRVGRPVVPRERPAGHVVEPGIGVEFTGHGDILWHRPMIGRCAVLCLSPHSW
jgi:hypothetical protein